MQKDWDLPKSEPAETLTQSHLEERAFKLQSRES